MAFRPVPGSSATYVTAGNTVGTVVLNAHGNMVMVSNTGSNPAWVRFGSSSPVTMNFLDTPVLNASQVVLDRNEDEVYMGCLTSATAQTTLYFTTGFETK